MALCEPNIAPSASEVDLQLPPGVPALRFFYLYLTADCNLRCRHCWIRPSFAAGGESAPGRHVPLELLQRAVEEAKPLGLAGAKLTGGEPTLHPQFVPIVDMLTAAGLSLNMETNGTTIDADLAYYLKERTSLTFISVSIDGPTAEIHDPFRGVEGSFDAAVRGLRHLVAAGYRPQVIASIHRGNLARVEEIVQLALELGAGSVKFNPVTRTGRGTTMHERGEALGPMEIIDLAHFVRGPLQQQTPVRLMLGTPLAFYTVGELLRLGIDGQCQIRHILGILGSGDMALCGIGQTIPQLCFGNLRETGVAEVWVNHPFLRHLREDLSGDYPGICGQCIHAPRCLAYCVAQNYFDRGELVSPPTMCLEAQRQGRFPASRLRQGK